MDKFEFLAGLGVPDAVISQMRASSGDGAGAVAMSSASNGSASATGSADKAKSAANQDLQTARGAALRAASTPTRYDDDDDFGPTPMALSEDSVPRPMPKDCKLVPGKIKNGPKQHVLCGKHGHVINTKTKEVIANTLADYNSQVWMDDEDMSTTSKDKEIAETTKTVHAVAPMRAEDEKKAADADRKNTLARYHDVAAAAHTAVLATTTKYEVAVSKACERFKEYADKYIDEMKEAESNELFVSLVEVAGTILLGGLGARVVELSGIEDLAKNIAEKIADKISEGLSKAAASAVPKGKGADALKAMLQSLIKQANTTATRVGKAAEDGIGVKLKEVADHAGAGSISDEEETLIKPFLASDYNLVLEAFRIPSDKSAAAIQVKVYGGLVKEFYAELWQQRRLAKDLGYGDSREAKQWGEKHSKEEMEDFQNEIDGKPVKKREE